MERTTHSSFTTLAVSDAVKGAADLRAVGAHFAFVAEFASPGTRTRARTIAFWATDHIAENYEWTLAGTPCEDVVHGKLCHHPSGVGQNFPEDRLVVELGIDSYLGVPLCDPEGKVLGNVVLAAERDAALAGWYTLGPTPGALGPAVIAARNVANASVPRNGPKIGASAVSW